MDLSLFFFSKKKDKKISPSYSNLLDTLNLSSLFDLS